MDSAPPGCQNWPAEQGMHGVVASASLSTVATGQGSQKPLSSWLPAPHCGGAGGGGGNLTPPPPAFAPQLLAWHDTGHSPSIETSAASGGCSCAATCALTSGDQSSHTAISFACARLSMDTYDVVAQRESSAQPSGDGGGGVAPVSISVQVPTAGPHRSPVQLIKWPKFEAVRSAEQPSVAVVPPY